MHNGKFSKGNENSIIKLEEALIIEALAADKEIVVDNTHLVPKHYSRISQLVDRLGIKNYEVVYKDFLDVRPEECIKRDLVRISHGNNI